jgi:hypothetical protein
MTRHPGVDIYGCIDRDRDQNGAIIAKQSETKTQRHSKPHSTYWPSTGGCLQVRRPLYTRARLCVSKDGLDAF